jgi:hypothetical protein
MTEQEQEQDMQEACIHWSECLRILDREHDAMVRPGDTAATLGCGHCSNRETGQEHRDEQWD